VPADGSAPTPPSPAAQPTDPTPAIPTRIIRVERVEEVPVLHPASYVTFTQDGQIHVDVRNRAQAKMAVRELRTKKKELALAKRAITQELRKIRAGYTHHVRRRGSKLIGGGSVGRIIRAVQTIDRDAVRRQLAHDLAPLEEHRSRIEGAILAIDCLMIQLQHYS
jgi:hypothetical protein